RSERRRGAAASVIPLGCVGMMPALAETRIMSRRLAATNEGSITQRGREKSIGVIAVGHSIVSPRDPQSGLPTGQRMHKPYLVTKELDMSTPLLYNVLCTNENLTEVTIKFFTPQIRATAGIGSETQHFTVKLTNANIASSDFHMENDSNKMASDDWESRT